MSASRGQAPSGGAVLAELLKNDVRYVVTVPDWVQIPLHRALQAAADRIRTLSCCTEDEAFMVAGGLHIGGAKSAIVIQQQGLYAGFNAVRGIGLDAELPLVMLIGQFGREPSNFNAPARQSTRRIVRMLEPLLDTAGIMYFKVAHEDDVGFVSKAFEVAHSTQSPAAVIFERNLAWTEVDQ